MERAAFRLARCERRAEGHEDRQKMLGGGMVAERLRRFLDNGQVETIDKTAAAITTQPTQADEDCRGGWKSTGSFSGISILCAVVAARRGPAKAGRKPRRRHANFKIDSALRLTGARQSLI